MLKRVFINCVLIIIGFIILFLQSNFFQSFTIAGIKPNLFVIYILFIGLFGTRSMGMIYGAFVGMFLDFIFNEKIGVYLFSYALIGVIATVLSRKFSKDSRITIMIMVFIATILFEVVVYIVNSLIFFNGMDLFKFIVVLFVEAIYNVILTVILYSLIQKYGYFIENEYKANKILTRYF